MSSKKTKRSSPRQQRILPKKVQQTQPEENVIYILSDQSQQTFTNVNDDIQVVQDYDSYQTSEEFDGESSSRIYQVIETQPSSSDKDSLQETLTIVGDIDDDDREGSNEIVYISNDREHIRVKNENNAITFMQIGGPDVASEETIETSMIVEIPEDGNSGNISVSHLTSDHCYTFKRGIKPKDIDKLKTKAAMLGEVESPGSSSAQPYTFILPKNEPPSTILTQSLTTPVKLLSELKKQHVYRDSGKCGKHRWLWQFMKELLFVGDPSLQWVNQKEGSFILRDQEGLAIKWECYKKMNNMKAQVWRQMRYYFGWMEENKIVRPIPDQKDKYFFVERFYREKFLPYKFKPHTDLKAISKMAVNLDGTELIMSRYRNGLKEKVYCQRGCGSQFINKEALGRHESVCTFSLPSNDTSC